MSIKSEKSSTGMRVYNPHKAGLPNLVEYFRELWNRRDFAKELSRTNLRASNTNTFLGQAWLVVNPLLLAAVYFLLVMVISGGANVDGGFRDGLQGFARICAGLFIYFYVTGIISAAATSVTGAGGLILNMSFPKMLLIMSQAHLALRRFIPTLVVYFAIHLAAGLPWTLHMLWLPVIIFLGTLMGIGLGAVVATWNVYFRDTSQFLPYFIRIWLYLSPVLYSQEQFMNTGIGSAVGELVNLNPLFSLLGGWGAVLRGEPAQPTGVIIATVWSVVALVVGVLYFISREREFAVRL